MLPVTVEKIKFLLSRETVMKTLDVGLQWVNVRQKLFRQI